MTFLARNKVMDTLAFGFGSPPDLAIILIVALIVLGPKKLPEVGKQLGQALRELRKVTDEISGVTHSVQSEVESLYKPVHAVPPVVIAGSSQTVDQAVKHQPLDQEPEPPLPAKLIQEADAHTITEKGL